MQDPLANRDELSGEIYDRSRGAKASPQGGHDVARQTLHYPVLVVDDDWAIRESLRLMLEDEGYAVSEARDGVEALAALRASSDAQVALLDLMMPRMSGEQVLENVQRDEHLQARVAFIVITADQGQVSKELRQQLAARRIPILDKPLDIDDVLTHVAAAEQRLPPAS
jgi:CheY-like chemotaxis protein